MVRFDLLTLVATSTLVQARFNLFQARNDNETGCSLSTEGNNVTRTVTVTEQAAAALTTTVFITQGEQMKPNMETITIERTIQHTITQNGNTVYITQSNMNEQVITKEVTVERQAPTMTVTVTREFLAQSDAGVRTEVDDAVTKTILEDGQLITLIVKPDTVTKTIAGDNGDAATKAVDQRVTVTAAPGIETLTRIADGHQTVIKTVADSENESDGAVVIVKNPSTGETTCQKKDSGDPCECPASESNVNIKTNVSIETACGSAIVSTIFNTVTVSVNPTTSQDSESTVISAQPTGKRSLARVPRGSVF